MALHVSEIDINVWIISVFIYKNNRLVFIFETKFLIKSKKLRVLCT